MAKSWIPIIAVLLNTRFASSFAPARHGRQSMTRGRQLFQSSIAVQEDFFLRNDSGYRNQYGYDDSSVSSEAIDVLERVDVNNNVFAPASTSAAAAEKMKARAFVQAEEQLNTLRSMSLKDLKLSCSRRNIQYGKFLRKKEKEEYIDAIWQDMKKALDFSVTGLVQPGAMVELTEDQLEQELSRRETLILVDAFATWCGPCRAIVPQLEIAAKKLVEDKVRVVKIDVDKHHSWAKRHQVEGLPAILLLQGDRVLDRLEGTYTTNEIVNFVQNHIE